MPTNSITNISSISWNDFHDTTLTDAQQTARANAIQTAQTFYQYDAEQLTSAFATADAVGYFKTHTTITLQQLNNFKKYPTEAQALAYLKKNFYKTAISTSYVDKDGNVQTLTYNGFTPDQLVSAQTSAFSSLEQAVFYLRGIQPWGIEALYRDSDGNRHSVSLGLNGQPIIATTANTEAWIAATPYWNPISPYKIVTNAGYAAVSADQAELYLRQASTPNASAIQFFDANGNMQWMTKDYFGAIGSRPLVSAVTLRNEGYTSFPNNNTINTAINATLPNGLFANADQAQSYLNQTSTPNATAVQFFDDSGNIRWATKDWAGTVVIRDATVTKSQLVGNGYVNFPLTPNQYTVSTEELNVELGAINFTATTQLSYSDVKQLLGIVGNGDGLAQAASTLDLAHGGGIKYYKGKWFANGQNVSFMQVYLAVRVNTLWDIQNELTTLLNRVQERNKKLDMANDFLTRLAAATPTDSSSSIAYSDGKTDNNNDLYDKVVKPWQTKYGVTSDPFSLYCPEANITKTTTVNGVTTTVDNGGPWKQAQLQGAATSVQSFIQTLQTNNTTDQSYIQNLTNRQGENTDAISNMIKSIATQLQSMASNFSTL